MREILFRGKRKDNGEWVKGIPVFFGPNTCKIITEACGCDYEDDGEIDTIYCIAYDIDPATIGQYTGLKDVNGKKIFDGDILNEHKNNTTGYIEYIVVWQKEYGRFALSYDSGNYCTPIISTNLYEIVGNIHDKPPMPTTEEIDKAINCYNEQMKFRSPNIVGDCVRTALWALEQEKERREKETKNEKIDK